MSRPSGASNGPRQTLVGVVVARLDSARLPGKALLRLAGRPLIDHAVARARRIGVFDELVLATSGRAVDDDLVEYARSSGLPVYRGSADDVAARVVAAASGHDYFARLNADSPFPDAGLLEQGWRLAADRPDVVTNLVGRTFPYGIAVEIVRVETLARMLATGAIGPAEREHVTAALYRNIDSLDVRTLTSPRPELAKARLIVDTPDDLARLEELYRVLGERVNTMSYVELAESDLRSRASA